jgi:hypothetical protein
VSILKVVALVVHGAVEQCGVCSTSEPDRGRPVAVVGFDVANDDMVRADSNGVADLALAVDLDPVEHPMRLIEHEKRPRAAGDPRNNRPFSWRDLQANRRCGRASAACVKVFFSESTAMHDRLVTC